jgi:hypothetical protein
MKRTPPVLPFALAAVFAIGIAFGVMLKIAETERLHDRIATLEEENVHLEGMIYWTETLPDGTMKFAYRRDELLDRIMPIISSPDGTLRGGRVSDVGVIVVGGCLLIIIGWAITDILTNLERPKADEHNRTKSKE